MILKDWRESFKADFLDSESQRSLLLEAREDGGGPEDIIASLRNIAWAQEKYAEERAELEATQKDNAPYLPDYRGKDDFAGFVTVCAALDALGLDFVLVRKQDAAQMASAADAPQTETLAVAA